MANEVNQLLSAPTEKLPAGLIENARATKRTVVGGRNLQLVWDGWRDIVADPRVQSLIRAAVGPDAGLVRILYFDKPPGSGWSLALHRDRTIAVAEHVDPLEPFGKPTRKAGVPHVEADEALLQQMLTLRLHVDPMHQSNGPVIVLPGSHRIDDEDCDHDQAHEVQTGAGDLFVMRPLISHGSRAPADDCPDHRRVIHLEIAPDSILPGACEWFCFTRVLDTPASF